MFTVGHSVVPVDVSEFSHIGGYTDLDLRGTARKCCFGAALIGISVSISRRRSHCFRALYIESHGSNQSVWLFYIYMYALMMIDQQ